MNVPRHPVLRLRAHYPDGVVEYYYDHTVIPRALLRRVFHAIRQVEEKGA